MFKFSLKSKQLSEIRDKELAAIKDVSSGVQFPNVFGSEQRIIIEKVPGTMKDVPSAFKKNPIDYVAAVEMAKDIERTLQEMSTDNYKYSIDISKNLIIRETKRIIPKGPKAGQEEIKKELIKLSTLRNLIHAYMTTNSHQKDKLDEIDVAYRKIFPEIKNDDGRADTIGQFIYSTEYHTDSARSDYEYEHPDEYNDFAYSSLEDDDLLLGFLDAAANMSSDNIIIVSRAPVDIIRMSDFPGKGGNKTGIVSCHSPKRKTTTDAGVPMKTGAYYDCAVYEAKNNGAVAYLVPRKAYEEHKDKFNSREFFKDLERESTEGAYPINRLRMRRYFYGPTQTEILVPEEVIYGQNGTFDLYRAVKEWLLSKQSSEVAKIKADPGSTSVENYILVGGSYADSHTADLMNQFLGIGMHRATWRAPGMTEKTISKIDEMVGDLLKISNIGGQGLSTHKRNKQIEFEEVQAGSPDRTAVKITVSTGNAVINLPIPPNKSKEEEIKSILGFYGVDLQKYLYDMMYPYFSTRLQAAGVTGFNVEVGDKNNPIISCTFVYSLPKNGNYSQEDITKAHKLAKLINLFFGIVNIQRYVDQKISQDSGKAYLEKQRQIKVQQQQQLTESVNRKRKLITRRGY